jgi:hypothetical protein
MSFAHMITKPPAPKPLYAKIMNQKAASSNDPV